MLCYIVPTATGRVITIHRPESRRLILQLLDSGNSLLLQLLVRLGARVRFCGLAKIYSITSKWLINLNSSYRSSISFRESVFIRSTLKDSTQKLASKLP